MTLIWPILLRDYSQIWTMVFIKLKAFWPPTKQGHLSSSRCVRPFLVNRRPLLMHFRKVFWGLLECRASDNFCVSLSQIRFGAPPCNLSRLDMSINFSCLTHHHVRTFCFHFAVLGQIILILCIQIFELWFANSEETRRTHLRPAKSSTLSQYGWSFIES